MSRNRRSDESELPLTDAEAELIAIQAEQGRLDLTDPDIRHTVTRAARAARKTRMWGGAGSRAAVRVAVLAGVSLILLWMAGLFVPLLVSAGR